MPIRPSGPSGAKVMIVGEFPKEQDLVRMEPFAGGIGFELSKMLAEANMHRESCFCTYVVDDRVPSGHIGGLVAESKAKATADHYYVNGRYVTKQVVDGIERLRTEIALVKPDVVCAMGNLALFALTGEWSAMSWRSSIMESTLVPGLKVIPTYSPAMVVAQMYLRPIVVHDLKRVAKHIGKPEITRPKQNFHVRPTFDDACFFLQQMINMPAGTCIGADIETRAGHIACIAFAWDSANAVCIPLMCQHDDEGYWTLDQETTLVSLMLQLMRRHKIIGQNWNYDAQYIYRHWHFLCPSVEDTMIQHHSCFSNMEKNLAFLSSMYLEDHLYWKDDRTNWDTGPKGEGENVYWNYNCTDAARTLAIHGVLTNVVKALGMEAVNAFQQRLAPKVLKSMNRGVRLDKEAQAALSMTIQAEVATRETWIATVLGHDLNIRSPKQMSDFFYRQMGQKEVINRKSKSVSCDDEALHKIASREPILKPLTRKIAELRSLGVFHSTFVLAATDVDGRIRTSFNVCGTETYRFSSTKNAFGSGLNMQNIPKGGETEDEGLDLPNVRNLYIPDPGMTYFDIDLDSADLRIVTWESDCKWMKEQFRAGNKPYIEVMKEYYHNPAMTKSSHPREYAMFKSLCHGCLTAGHEVLTATGWVKVEDYDKTQPLMTWDKTTWKAQLEVPKEYFVGEGNHFIHFSGQSYDTEVTHDHRVPYTTTDKHSIHVCSAIKVPASARIPMCGFLDGEVSVKPLLARLLSAFQADGTLDTYGNVLFHFHKPRKITRLQELLEALAIGYTWNGSDRFYIPHREAHVFTIYGKQAGAYLLSWGAAALDAYLDELQHWDGWSGGTVKCQLSTIHKDHADWLQTIAKLRGMGAQVNVHREAGGSRQTLYRLSLNNRQFHNMASGTRTEEKLVNATRPIYCPITSTGFFFVRRNGRIGITGNTNYLGTADGIAPRIGLLVHETERIQKWYFDLCPEIKKWQEEIKAQVTKRRYVQNVYGYRTYFFDRIEGTIFNQAVAWIPQSTVACLINRAYVRIDDELSREGTEVLLQVHDSLVGQFPTLQGDAALRKIVACSENPLPYAEPLVIPVGIATSTKSWGDCR